MAAPINCVEFRNAGYYVVGTRIGLDVLFNGLQSGKSAEDLLASFPALGSLDKIRGAIAFIQENPLEMEDYLNRQARLLAEIQQIYPMSEDMLLRFEQAKRDATLKIA